MPAPPPIPHSNGPPQLNDRARKGSAIRIVVAIVGLVILGLLGFGVAFGFSDASNKALSAISTLWTGLKAAPAPIYFLIMAIALIAPLPISAFYITAGPIYGIGTSLLWIAPALALNALLIHMLAGSTLRLALESLVTATGRTLPQMAAQRDQNLFILLVRITPGIPYFLQSWGIALAGVKRTPFVLITVATQMLYAAGFVILGRSAFEGRAGLAVSAVALLVCASIIARMVHLRLNRPSPEQEQPLSE